MAKERTVGTTGDVMRWFAQGRTNGKNRQGNLFIEGDTIYSYGHHFPIARRLTDGVCVLNADDYSVTTSGHKDGVHSDLQEAQIPCVHASSRYSPIDLLDTDYKTSYEVVDLIRDETRWGDLARDKPPVGSGWSVSFYPWNPNSWTASRRSAILIRITNSVSDLLGSGRSILYTRDGSRRFSCLLPGNPISVRDAVRSLQPPEVMDAVEDGLAVQRQGDWFFIPTPWATRELPRPSTYAMRLPEYASLSQHIATETRIKEGRTYCRGIIRHRHRRRLKLGDAWHLAVRCRALASWTVSSQPRMYVDVLPSPPPLPPPPTPPTPELTPWEKIERARDKRMGVVRRKVFV